MTTIPLQPHPRLARAVALRPLALPTEHGGWGFLIEPIALGLLVAPSWSGVLGAAKTIGWQEIVFGVITVALVCDWL